MTKLNKNQLFSDPYLPHNFLAEKLLLSCLLGNLEAIEKTIKLLPIEAFYFRNHQEIYRTIILMYQNKFLIDILSLTTFLQQNGLLKKVGGLNVLLELTKQIPNLIYLDDYIRLIKDKFLRRSLIKLGYKIINISYVTNIPLEHLLKNVENELFLLSNKTFVDKQETNTELLNIIFTKLKMKFLNPSLPGLTSGFSNLDELTQGFQNSDLIILAGRPSMGKTAFSLNIVLNILKITQLPIIFFSLEMSREQLMYRLLSLETSINQICLKNGKLSQNDWVKLNKTIKILSKLPLFLEDNSNLSISDLRAKIRTLFFEQTNIGLIIIDYLQLINNSGLKYENRAQELSQITRSLKSLAREFNVPILALSQLSRNVETRTNQKPMLSDLRESGSIEQDADLILLLHKDKSSSSDLTTRNVIIAKHRNGPTGTIKFLFNSNDTRFTILESNRDS